MKTSEHRRDIVRRSREKNKHKYAEKKKASDKAYYEKNKDKVLAQCAIYRDEHRAERNKKSQAINKARLQTDDAFRITCLCRTRIKNFLRSKHILQTGKTFDLIGCTNEFLKLHLESEVEAGKTLRDYEIDHIFPLSAYDMKTEQRKAMHWTNLQLLSKKLNNRKNKRLPLQDMALKVDREMWPSSVGALSMLPASY